MDMILPEDFIRLRKPMLLEEWDAFAKSFQGERAYGLRRNPLKDCGELPFEMEQVPWAPEGFYVSPEEHPGRHPLHEAGAYYIQEPSAMSVVSLLDPCPGETVCDLCAAPGGKSTQIAGRLQGKGFFVCNEIFPNRAKILSQNIERMGVTNALVCNEPPDRMASLFPLCFDRILVDAPCSGEGMFRKDDTAISEWSPENITLCARRQRMILNCADELLKPGGVMVYSTCTFAPEENEEIIVWFLATHPDYVLEDWRETRLGEKAATYDDHAGLSQGKPKYVDWKKLAASLDGEISATTLEQALSTSLAGTLRLWPHKLKGEGHFAARLRKTGTWFPEEGKTTLIPAQNPTIKPFLLCEEQERKKTDNKKRKQIKTRKKGSRANAQDSLLTVARNGYEEFRKDFLQHMKDSPDTLVTRYELFGEELYQLPPQAPSLSGIKIIRAGLHLGSSHKNRFEPSYALAKALSRNQARQIHDCTYEEAVRYLKGETLSCDSAHKSWTLVCYQGCPLGWGKAQNGMLKNHFPKGLRRSV